MRVIEVDMSDVDSDPELNLTFHEFRNMAIAGLVKERKITLEQIGALVYPPICKQHVCYISAKYNGVLQKQARRPASGWTEEEDKLLRDGWTTMSQIALREVTHRGSWSAVSSRANRLGLTGRPANLKVGPKKQLNTTEDKILYEDP